MDGKIDCVLLYDGSCDVEKCAADVVYDYFRKAHICCGLCDAQYLQGVDIADSEVIVIIYSKNTNNSESIKSFINKAFNANKILIPVVLDLSPMDDELYYYLNRKHWIVVDGDIKSKINELIQTINIVLGHSNAFTTNKLYIKIISTEGVYVFINNEMIGEVEANKTFCFNAIRDIEYDIELRAVENPLFKIAFPKTKVKDESVVVYADFSNQRKDAIDSMEERKSEFQNAEIYNADPWWGIRVFRLDGKEGYINKYYQRIMGDLLFDEAFLFEKDGYACIKNGYYRGLVDIFGNVVIPPNKFSHLVYEDKESIQVIDPISDRWGIVNVKGDVVVECKYLGVCSKWDFANKRYFYVSKNKEDYYVVNSRGEEFIDDERGWYQYVLNSDLIAFYPSGANVVELLNADKQVVYSIAKRYSEIDMCSENIAMVKDGGLWGLYDLEEGKEILPPMYRFILPYSEGLAAVVNQDNFVGFVDINGALKIKCLFQYDPSVTEDWKFKEEFVKYGLFTFKNGVCKVNRCGLSINKNGEVCR